LCQPVVALNESIKSLYLFTSVKSNMIFRVKVLSLEKLP
jgi:hypothetical protein